MKEQFIQYLKNQQEKNNLILAKNSISDEDKAIVTSAQENLAALLEQVEAMPDEDPEILNELKNTVAALQESITAIKEKLTQQNKPEEEMKIENTYLSTKNSLHDFAEVIRTSKNAEEFCSNWNEKLITNGVTIADGSSEAYLPEAVRGMITDIWDKNAGFLKDLNHSGAKRFYVRYNPTDQTIETSRAKGHKAGDTKAEQSIGLNSKLIDAQFIYKIQSLDKKTEWNDDGTLVNYVVKELISQIIYEIKRAIIAGDGRDAASDYKISSFETLVAASTDTWHVVSTATADGFLKDDLVASVASVENPNGKPMYMLMTKATANGLRRVQASSTSTPVYMPMEQLADELGVNEIITTDLLPATYAAVTFIPDEYIIVGDNILSPEFYQWHVGESNVNKYRAEVCAGGGINAMKSVAVLKA